MNMSDNDFNKFILDLPFDLALTMLQLKKEYDEFIENKNRKDEHIIKMELINQ